MNVEELKKNIEVFGKGVERLEQLKAEFVKIKISGHEKEAEEIMTMLKDVSAIPELEIRINKLKNSVRNIDKLNRKYSDISPSKIDERISDLKERFLKKKLNKGKGVSTLQIAQIKKELKEIKEAIEQLSKRKGSKLTSDDLKNIQDIPLIEKQILNLRLDIGDKLDKKIEEEAAEEKANEEEKLRLNYELKLKDEIKKSEEKIRSNLKSDIEFD